MPLIVEIWSPSTGEYDLDVKLAAHQARGDAEIWRIHPGERQIERWILRDDGTWQSSRVHLGSIVPSALPDVSIDLAALFSILG